MEKLNLPFYDCKLKKSGTNTLIFDPVRQKYVILTPEEWVRQHFLNYLTVYLGFPRSHISIERGTTYNTLAKRTDLRVYGRTGSPLMLIECKASYIQIDESALNQALVYNRVIKAPYLVLTNGLQHFCWKIDPSFQRWQVVAQIPEYDKISGD